MRSHATGASSTKGKEQRRVRRWTVASGLLLAGGAHLPVTSEHLKEAPIWGVLFVLFTLTTWMLAVAIVRFDSRRCYFAAVAISAAAIGTYVVSRLIPLPQISEDVGMWLEPWGVISVLVELSTVAAAVGGLRRHG